MHTAHLTPQRLATSVWAVPPLARSDDDSPHAFLNMEANRQIMSHIEAGGISTLLYGGNAILYHIALSEYQELLAALVEQAAPDTLVVPSVGPAFGMMMDQADILRDFDFPTAMLLPQQDAATSNGIETAVRRFVQRFQKPVVLYIKHDRAIEPDAVGRLMSTGQLSAIKYAVPRADPSQDTYLREIIDCAGTQRTLSGLGDQPAPIHLTQFGLAGFTTGCGCVAPRLCGQLLAAIRSGNAAQRDKLLAHFRPLEDLRNRLGPITVLHAAFQLADIANTGPVTPLLSAVDTEQHDAIRTATLTLLAAEANAD